MPRISVGNVNNQPDRDVKNPFSAPGRNEGLSVSPSFTELERRIRNFVARGSGLELHRGIQGLGRRAQPNIDDAHVIVTPIDRRRLGAGNVNREMLMIQDVERDDNGNVILDAQGNPTPAEMDDGSPRLKEESDGQVQLFEAYWHFWMADYQLDWYVQRDKLQTSAHEYAVAFQSWWGSDECLQWSKYYGFIICNMSEMRSFGDNMWDEEYERACLDIYIKYSQRSRPNPIGVYDKSLQSDIALVYDGGEHLYCAENFAGSNIRNAEGGLKWPNLIDC